MGRRDGGVMVFKEEEVSRCAKIIVVLFGSYLEALLFVAWRNQIIAKNSVQRWYRKLIPS